MLACAVLELDCQCFALDIVRVFRHSCLDRVVRVHSDHDLIHHLVICLLAQLLYLGDQFSCQTFVNQLRSERRVEDGENIVFTKKLTEGEIRCV